MTSRSEPANDGREDAAAEPASGIPWPLVEPAASALAGAPAASVTMLEQVGPDAPITATWAPATETAVVGAQRWWLAETDGSRRRSGAAAAGAAGWLCGVGIAALLRAIGEETEA